jgi:polyhydroxyalkanoate synthesis repressor PhaR
MQAAEVATVEFAARRVIKRYSNRKLYDTKESRYVTLLQIAEMVRAGEDVQIVDNSSKEDKTDVTLALIISEELKVTPRAIPLNMLRALVCDRGERLLARLEGGLSALGAPDSPNGDAGTGHHGLDRPGNTEGDMAGTGSNETRGRTVPEQQLKEAVSACLGSSPAVKELQEQVRLLSDRLEALERELRASRESGQASE